MSRIAGYLATDGRRVEPSLLARMAAGFNLAGAGVATVERDGFGLALVEVGTDADELERRIAANGSGVAALDGRGAGQEAAQRWLEQPGTFLGALPGDLLAGALYDAERHAVTVFRDRFGARAIYYAWTDGLFLFASEIKALLACDEVSFPLDREMLARFLATNYRMWFGRAQTFFENLYELPLAAYVTADGERPRSHRYWAPPDAVLPEAAPDDEYVRLYRDAVERVVGAALGRSSRRLFLVSGGLDSPVIAATAAKLLGERIDCCAAVFPGHENLDESRYVGALTEALGAEVILEALTPEQFLDTYERMLERHDQPLLSPTYVLFFHLLELGRERGYDTVFGGGGGDIVSQGCLEYQPYLLADYARFGERAYAREIDAWCERVGPFLRYWPGEPGRMRALIDRLVDWEQPGLIRNNPDWIRPDRSAFGPALASASAEAPPVGVRYGTYRQSRIAEEIFHQAIATHFVEDLNAASFTLSGADPFWDVELVELGFQLPVRMLLHDGWTKYVVRQANVGVLPEPLRCRAEKSGLGLPFSEWFRDGPVAEAFEQALGSPAIQELIDVDHVRGAFEAHRAGADSHGDLVWKVFAVSRWAERWLS